MESGTSELTSDILSHLSAYPAWSVAAHVVVGVVVLALQRTVRDSREFSSWNEYLCTLLWVCWTLETSVIGFASSSTHVVFSLFIRLLLWPLLFHDACVNPLNSVYLAVQENSVRKVPWCLGLQFTAMISGLVYSSLSWQLLSLWFSDTHLNFMTSRVNPFLNVGTLEGFLLELGMSFIMYLPRLVMKTGFTSTFLSASVTCVMIMLLEHTTGAFMNPLIALSSSLLWHSGSLTAVGGVWEQVVVYWLAPTLGTVLVASLDMWLSRTKQNKLHLT